MELVIEFHGVDHSEALAQRIHAESAKLEHLFDRIISCRVVVEKPHRRHKHGDLFAVRLHLTLAAHKQINVTRNPEQHEAHQDPYIAVRDVFQAAARAVQDEARKLRGDVKTHQAVGSVAD